MKMTILSTFCALAVISSGHAVAVSRPHMSEDIVTEYVRSRLIDPRNARIRMDQGMYPVTATVKGREWSGWAMDIRLDARVALGRRTGFYRRTVLIGANGPVAFRSDVEDFQKH